MMFLAFGAVVQRNYFFLHWFSVCWKKYFPFWSLCRLSGSTEPVHPSESSKLWPGLYHKGRMFWQSFKQKTCIIVKLHSCAPWAYLHLKRVLDKSFSLLLKPRDTDGVSHVRLNKCEVCSFNFFCNKEISNTGINCWLEMLFCKIWLFVYNSVGSLVCICMEQ